MRPTWKERCPLVAMGRYLEWRRHDGSPFDPWIRAHERMGGEILAAAPESMTIRASVTDWEDWTGMPFPEDGEYVFPGGLAALSVRDSVGTHVSSRTSGSSTACSGWTSEASECVGLLCGA